MHVPYVCGFAWSDTVHGCVVYTECAKMAAVSCGSSHASAVSLTPLWWIFKNELLKGRHSCRIACESSESAWEQRLALYKSNQQQQGCPWRCKTVLVSSSRCDRHSWLGIKNKLSALGKGVCCSRGCIFNIFFQFYYKPTRLCLSESESYTWSIIM